MEKRFQIIIGSPIDYEELVAYIRIDDEEIAMVQKDEGIDKMKIEFFEDKIKIDLYLDVFIEALKEAKVELLK
ncbi:hypothetical protein ABH942_002469 [Flavobacterium sp. 28YEA47A]|uniref:hypothetical protein n=1 Tax=Flavobacterium sp. 28YEA47A TaxID=3156276 RepID=UPI003513A175